MSDHQEQSKTYNTDHQNTGGVTTNSGGENRSVNENKSESQGETQKKANAGDNSSGTAVEMAKETASNLLDQAKSTAGDAYDAVSEKAGSVIEEQKLELMMGLSGVADTVRRVSGALSESDPQLGATKYAAQYTETAAQKLEGVAQYFEETEVRAMVRDAESYARRNPAIFLGGAFIVGVLAARFFKSSPAALATEKDTNGGSQATSKRSSGSEKQKSAPALA